MLLCRQPASRPRSHAGLPLGWGCAESDAQSLSRWTSGSEARLSRKIPRPYHARRARVGGAEEGGIWLAQICMALHPPPVSRVSAARCSHIC